MNNVIIKGPFWSAVVDFAKLADVRENSAFRNLYLDQRAASDPGLGDLHLPGTQIALCFVKSVTIQPDTNTSYNWTLKSGDTMPPASVLDAEGIRAHITSGDLSLLIVQANPEDWSTADDGFTEMTCLAGEIVVDRLAQQGSARSRLFDHLALEPCETTIDEIQSRIALRPGHTGLLGELTLHASGFSLYGKVQLPWEDAGVFSEAPFRVARVQPDKEEGTQYELKPEFERFTEEEEERWQSAWLQLSRDLNPRHPLNGIIVEDDEFLPHWVTMEIVNPRSIPDLYWDILPWNAAPKLNFAEGEISLILSDRHPYDPQNPPVSLARVVPETIQIVPDNSGGDTLEIKIGSEDLSIVSTYEWGQLDADSEPITDKLSLLQLALAFSPIETPDQLRTSQNLPLPEWNDRTKPVEPACVWGYVPLENGWAQLPVPNFTEQIFLDSEQENANNPASTVSQLEGVVAYGNENEGTLNDRPEEQPWNLTITRLAKASGVWKLSRLPADSASAGRRYSFHSIKLDIVDPEIILNGLFWLSTGKPRAEDALPDLGDWVNGLQSIPLRTHKPATDLFPSPVFFKFDQIVLAARSAADASASLDNWQAGYEADPTVFTAMTEITPAGADASDEPWRLLPADFFSLYKAWVWLRHLTLPMIQTLPLTQNDLPPNYPNRSRQLAPFELRVDEQNRPANWSFGVAPFDVGSFDVESGNGASRWPLLTSSASPAPAAEWQTYQEEEDVTELFDLPLAALSLPGLVLDAKEAPGLFEGGTSGDGGIDQLNPQLRFDLPYTDQVNALAQLPPEPKTADEVSPLPESEPPKPPEPLTRETFANHWLRMSERASLSRADATDVIEIDDAGEKGVQNLVEPLKWPIEEASIDGTAYPGSIVVKGKGLSEARLLEEDEALRGLSGVFHDQDDGTMNDVSGNGASFEIEAGSMAASVSIEAATDASEEDTVWYRDQRGLSRAASRVGTRLVKTPIRFAGGVDTANDKILEDRYDLTTALTSFPLHIGNDLWHFWFRDLPVANGSFVRETSDVAEARDLDINDPEAASKELNFLTGYEWRLGDPAEHVALPLFGLHFHPLTLVNVAVVGDAVSKIQIDGRLQLPLEAVDSEKPPFEQTDFSNIVRITFLLDEMTGALTFQGSEAGDTSDAILLQSEVMEWPVALRENEFSNAPLLCWTNVALVDDDGTEALEISGLILKFFQFEASWIVNVPALRFAADGTGPEVVEIALKEENAPSSPLTPEKVTLHLNPAVPAHSVSLSVIVKLGREREMADANAERRGSFSAVIAFDLLAGDGSGTSWESATLFDDIDLETDSDRFVVRDSSMQFQWLKEKSTAEAGAKTDNGEITASAEIPEDLQLLPGMFLTSGDAPGFAALTFEAEANESGIPTLVLQSAFIEALLQSQWSEFLQEATSPVAITEEVDPIFDSSAGDLFFGYTATWQGDEGWREVLLLNGFLEVKNLVSWPAGMEMSADKTKLTLPAQSQADSLDHYRHSIRILFNQHQVPVDLIVVGSGKLLFDFASELSWQFLAVVEHQIVHVTGGAVLGADRRWTTVQEVRIASPNQFKSFLQALGDGGTIVPTASGTANVGSSSYGYLTPGIRTRLSEGADAELDKLASGTFIVEASAPHWINLEPITGVSETTLQFLPNGTQDGILSRPEYYGPSDPRSPQWLLLSLPFIGRLQNENKPEVSGANTPLHVDPIKYLSTAAEDKSLAFNLTSWGAEEPVDILLSGFDTAVGRTWARLDPNTLQESWFRVQHPQKEPETEGLQSVMAALPDTPARMGRSTALHQIFNVHRSAYPPSSVTANALLETQVASADPLEWRPGSWFVPQEVSKVTIEEDTPEGLVALYTFEEGEGTIVRDRSGAGTPLDLQMQRRISFPDNWENLDDPGTHAEWVEGGGLEILNSMILRSVAPATALNEACRASSEITIEAWIRPADFEQGVDDPARIVSLAESTSNRNVTLGYKRVGNATQANYDCSYRLNNNGRLEFKRVTPRVSADVEDRVHVVYVHENTGVSRMYIDGVEVTQRSDAGDFINWISGFSLVLGNEITGGDVPWRGVYFLLALYDRALQPEEVQSHFEAGTVEGGRTLDNSFKWYAPGLHMLDAGLIATEDANTPLRAISRHAAATALPALLNTEAGENRMPVSFAVSPYLGLKLKRAVDSYKKLLVSVELLCLDEATGVLLPIASHFLNAGESSGSVTTESVKWGEETHRKLCPDSPFAILRFREINEPDEEAGADPSINQAILTATYGYAILTKLSGSERFARKVFPLRSEIKALRFREGQFGGFTLPFHMEAVPTDEEVPEGDAPEDNPVEDNPAADNPAVENPAAEINGAINTFEFAPPQTVGVQPLHIPGQWRIIDPDGEAGRKHYAVIAVQGGLSLYESQIDENTSNDVLHLVARVTDRAVVKNLKMHLEQDSDTLNTVLAASFPEANLSAQTFVSRAWPWGVSGLRSQVTYTEGNNGIAGPLEIEEGADRTLWWQAQPYQVQYRAARSGRPVAGLPTHFRAEAIKGFLPVLPNPPMPAIGVSDEDAFNASASVADRWQAILPGSLSYMIVGDRSGVSFAFRNQLIRQSGLVAGENTRGSVMVSGSMPVQHRMPRPVALPHTGRRDRALQTWASFFEPDRLLSAESVPIDEAFFAGADAYDALRFQLKLVNPAPGSLSSNWNKELIFAIAVDVEGGNASEILPEGNEFFGTDGDPDIAIADFITEHIREWISIEISDKSRTYRYEFVAQSNGNEFVFRLTADDQGAFDAFFGGVTPGSALRVIARIGHPEFTDDYYQALPLSMHRIDEDKFRLPLRPYFVQFEDPEYNRRLSSAATQGTRNLKINITDEAGEVEKELSTVTFSTDRKEYNPDSRLSLRFDWESAYAGEAMLKIERIEAGGGNPIVLFQEVLIDDQPEIVGEVKVFAGKLKQIQLNELLLGNSNEPADLREGISLQLTLRITQIDTENVALFEEQHVVLNVDIVDESVIPKPEAAYALLRGLDASATAVECARFAWGPEASRIDLISPDDLRTGIVRRRAVFNWSDVVRPNPFKGYTVQKITQTGSTHFPDIADFIGPNNTQTED